MMNFFKEKKSTTQRDPKEERVIKSKKKKKRHESTLINPPNSRIKSWDCDNPIKRKTKKTMKLICKKINQCRLMRLKKKISNKKIISILVSL